MYYTKLVSGFIEPLHIQRIQFDFLSFIYSTFLYKIRSQKVATVVFTTICCNNGCLFNFYARVIQLVIFSFNKTSLGPAVTNLFNLLAFYAGSCILCKLQNPVEVHNLFR